MSVFVYRVAKYIGAYAVALAGLDPALSGSIGEHSSPMRSRIAACLSFLGVMLDPDANGRETKSDSVARISGDESLVPLYICPADEDGKIARAVCNLYDLSRNIIKSQDNSFTKMANLSTKSRIS
jgi:acetate kinase